MSDKELRALAKQAFLMRVRKAAISFDGIPGSREMSLALTKLEEAEMWAERIK